MAGQLQNGSITGTKVIPALKFALMHFCHGQPMRTKPRGELHQKFVWHSREQAIPRPISGTSLEYFYFKYQLIQHKFFFFKQCRALPVIRSLPSKTPCKEFLSGEEQLSSTIRVIYSRWKKMINGFACKRNSSESSVVNSLTTMDVFHLNDHIGHQRHLPAVLKNGLGNSGW